MDICFEDGEGHWTVPPAIQEGDRGKSEDSAEVTDNLPPKMRRRLNGEVSITSDIEHIEHRPIHWMRYNGA